MARVTRADRTIVIVLVAVLAALVGLGLAQRGGPDRSAERVTTATAAVSTRVPSPSATAAPSSPSAPPSVPVAPTTVSPSPSSTAPVPTTTTAPSPIAGPVTAVGDSIMIDIQPYLQTDVPGVQV
ncbi:MAG TPA: hypothetical protein VHW93_11565, partial [Acidimicrobiales bacterium]|nr:hypothetical protein [Acidimicrobiales bacterium]